MGGKLFAISKVLNILVVSFEVHPRRYSDFYRFYGLRKR